MRRRAGHPGEGHSGTGVDAIAGPQREHGRGLVLDRNHGPLVEAVGEQDQQARRDPDERDDADDHADDRERAHIPFGRRLGHLWPGHLCWRRLRFSSVQFSSVRFSSVRFSRR